jgi:IS605 OrfB family transposase
VTNLHPVLYRGQCILFEDDSVQIKVFNGKEWCWQRIAVAKRGKRHLLNNAKSLSPSLLINRKGVFLAVPFEVTSPKLGKPQLVCGVDLGLNTIAVASIVSPDGTVTARKFFNSCAADIDRRDKRLQAIRHKARLTMGKTGRLYKGFCQSIYRKAQNINQQICQLVSKQLITWAQSQGATVIVFENLKGWRPKGGKKGSTLRQRFHGWLKSRLVQLTTDKFTELGGKVEFVFPRGTSSYAYDGSGKLRRDCKNYALARFKSGKQYNCDLSASYNIAARFWLKQNPLGEIAVGLF